MTEKDRCQKIDQARANTLSSEVARLQRIIEICMKVCLDNGLLGELNMALIANTVEELTNDETP